MLKLRMFKYLPLVLAGCHLWLAGMSFHGKNMEDLDEPDKKINITKNVEVKLYIENN